MMEQQWTSQRKATPELGFKSHRATQKAIESGRIPESAVQRDADGKVTAVDVIAAKAALAASTDPVNKADGTGNLNVGGRGGVLLQARAKEKFYSAALRELEYLKQAGSLTSVVAVEKEAAETARQVRNGVLAIYDRMAPMLNASQQKALKAEIEKAVRELATGLEQRSAALAGADEREPALL